MKYLGIVKGGRVWHTLDLTGVENHHSVACDLYWELAPLAVVRPEANVPSDAPRCKKCAAMDAKETR